jgi:serine/threonine-protein kinase
VQSGKQGLRSSADFQEAWLELAPQFEGCDADVTQSLRPLNEPAPAADAAGPQGLELGHLPLLRAESGEQAEELITQKLLGEGGMGKVELAIQRSLQREVAIKSIREGSGRAESHALLQEALFTGLLEHPNIVPVHQLGRSSEDQPLLVMKRVEGVSWEDLIRDPKHRHWETLGEDRLREHLAIMISVCHAVEFAHARGIVHRDIKPANVMVGAFGEVYLLDWGLGMRLDPRPDSTLVVGTPSQMAPEMLEGNQLVDERTDVYLLGAALHTALTGEPRHAGDSIVTVMFVVYASAPIEYGESVPAELAELCNRATHADPAQRPSSAAELRQALERFLEHRASIELAQETGAALAGLRAELAQPQPEAERLAALVAECRFGFGQALRGWPENAAAREGLQECLTLMIERELELGDVAHAEALLVELPSPAPELASRVAALREEQRLAEARLRELEGLRDWRQGAGMRLGFFLFMNAFVVGLWLWANDGHLRYQGTLSPERLATHVGVAFLSLCGLVFLMRRELMSSPVNARLVKGALVTGGAIFVNRLGNCIPTPPTAALVSGEILFCGLAAAVGAVTMARWLWCLVPIWILGAFAARWFSGYAGLCFASTSLIALAVAVWCIRAERAKADR